MSKEEINAFLGAGTVYEGKLSFKGAVRIDGIFSGEITSDGALIAGRDAVVAGQLHVGELVLSGNFTGEVRAKKRVVIHKGGVLNGKVYSPNLMVEDGGVLEGLIQMRESSARDTPRQLGELDPVDLMAVEVREIVN